AQLLVQVAQLAGGALGAEGIAKHHHHVADLVHHTVDHGYLFDQLAAGHRLDPAADIRHPVAHALDRLAQGIAASAKRTQALAQAIADAGDGVAGGSHQVASTGAAHYRYTADGVAHAGHARAHARHAAANLGHHLADDRGRGRATTVVAATTIV
uniref:Chemotaxis protein n=1 Tax=Steinernema glaseri TaxID=37863 RepID=A0A1I8AMB9_9BILA